MSVTRDDARSLHLPRETKTVGARFVCLCVFVLDRKRKKCIKLIGDQGQTDTTPAPQSVNQGDGEATPIGRSRGVLNRQAQHNRTDRNRLKDGDLGEIQESWAAMPCDDGTARHTFAAGQAKGVRLIRDVFGP